MDNISDWFYSLCNRLTYVFKENCKTNKEKEKFINHIKVVFDRLPVNLKKCNINDGIQFGSFECTEKSVKELYNALDNSDSTFLSHLKSAVGNNEPVYKAFQKLHANAKSYYNMISTGWENINLQTQVKTLTEERDKYEKLSKNLVRQLEDVRKDFDRNLKMIEKSKHSIAEVREKNFETERLLHSKEVELATSQKESNHKRIQADSKLKQNENENINLSETIDKLNENNKSLELSVEELKQTIKAQEKDIQELINVFDKINQSSLKAFAELENEANQVLQNFGSSKEKEFFNQEKYRIPENNQDFDFDHQREVNRIKSKAHESLGRAASEQERIDALLKEFKKFATTVQNKSKQMRKSINESISDKNSLADKLKNSKKLIEDQFNTLDQSINNQSMYIKVLEKINQNLLIRIKEQESMINALDLENQRLEKALKEQQKKHDVELKEANKILLKQEKEKTTKEIDKQKELLNEKGIKINLLKNQVKQWKSFNNRKEDIIYHLQENQEYSFKKIAPIVVMGLGGVGGGIYLTTNINESLSQGIVGICLIALSVLVSSYLIYDSGRGRNYMGDLFKSQFHNNHFKNDDKGYGSPNASFSELN